MASVVTTWKKCNFEIVKVKNGGEGYYTSNYLFNKNKSRGDKIYLKCLESKCQVCTARAVICNGEAELTNEDHNHGVTRIPFSNSGQKCSEKSVSN